MRELNKFRLYISKVLLNLHNVPLLNINCTEPYLGALYRSNIIVQNSDCKISERVLLNGAMCKRFSKVSRRRRCTACHLLQVFNSINAGGEDIILAFKDDEEEVERPATTRSGRSINRRSRKIENWLFFLLILYIFYVWKIVKKCLSKWTEFVFWINRSGCYICRMSCQQLYIEQKIQTILYTAKYMHVRFNLVCYTAVFSVVTTLKTAL